MRYDKRIWKTAAIALVITIVAGAFVMRLGDWAKGLNSEFIVYGQTGSGSSGGSGSGGSGSSGTVTQTQIIPQVAVSSFDGNITAYQTFIIVSNPTTAPVTVAANFYTTGSSSSTAAVPSTVIGFTQTTVAAGAASSTVSTFTGSTTNPVTLPAGATVTFQSQALASGVSGTTGWGKIVSTSTSGTSANVVITAGYTISYVQGGVISIVGVAASPANMQTFTIARSRNENAGLDTGFAIVNTGTTTATLTATLQDLSGATIQTASIQLSPGQQVAEFGAGLFYPSSGKAVEPTFTGTNVFTMTFDVTKNCTASAGCAQFAATALTFEGAIQASYPVTQLK